MKTTYYEFLRGFAESANLKMIQADDQWAGYSCQLSDSDRQKLESCGYAEGLAQGKDWLAIYGGETK